MELNQLVYFQAVAATENMTRAAEQLHITQPTLSKVISRLESDLGYPLFDRRSSRLTLNEYGRAFLAYSKHALDTLERGRQSLESIHLGQLHKVRIAATFLGLSQMITEHFAIDNPEIDIIESRASATEATEMLLNQQVDFVLSMVPIMHPDIHQERLMTEPLILAIPSRRDPYPSSHAYLSEFQHDRFGIFEGGSDMRELIISLCKRANFVPDIAYECDESHSVGRLMNAKDIVTLMPVHPLLDPTKIIIDPVQIVMLDDGGCHRSIYLSWQIGKPLSAYEIRFIDYIREVINNIKQEIRNGLPQFGDLPPVIPEDVD